MWCVSWVCADPRAMTENRRVLPGGDPPPEPALGADQASRRPNGLDHMGFLLQVVQVVPIMMSLFGLFLTSVWALRVTTAATLVVAWGAIMLLSRDGERRRNGRKRSAAPGREESDRAATAHRAATADRATTADGAAMPCESGEVLER